MWNLHNNKLETDDIDEIKLIKHYKYIGIYLKWKE
jgi:hypothetical protein